MYGTSRLALILLLGTAVVAPAPIASAEEAHQVVLAENLKWSTVPTLPKGSEIAVLAGDPAADGLFVLRVRSPEGTVFAPHWHSQAEQVTVIEGTFHVGKGEQLDRSAADAVPAGGFFMMPREMRHFGWVEGTTVLQVAGMGPFDINYVNPMDDPSKQAAQ